MDHHTQKKHVMVCIPLMKNGTLCTVVKSKRTIKTVIKDQGLSKYGTESMASIRQISIMRSSDIRTNAAFQTSSFQGMLLHFVTRQCKTT